MKRGIKRSLVRPTKTASPFDEVDPTVAAETAEPTANSVESKISSGAGSAWKAGAVAQAQASLDEAREYLATDILSGSQVIEIDPAELFDPIGSDRRDDWMEQDDFLAFVESIRENGQDMPVLVWPKDPGWQPDEIDPRNLEHVQFLLLAGRRRREAARILGRPVRAVVASQAGRDGVEATFNMLVLRFRENDEREGLSAFERLLSIGQMYSELAASSSSKIKAKEFAERVGVHESVVSRARAVFARKDQILSTFKNVYDLSYRELQQALAEITAERKHKEQAKPKAQKITVKRKVGSRNLLISAVNGKLSVSAAGMNLDKQGLEGLGDIIAAYLQEQHGVKK